MSYPFNNEQPIYLQLIDIYKQKFVRGELMDGDQLPSVREVAMIYGVNEYGSKAFSELDRDGFTKSERTAGRFVTLTQEQRKVLQEEMARQYLGDFLDKMRALGIDRQDIHRMIGEERE